MRLFYQKALITASHNLPGSIKASPTKVSPDTTLGWITPTLSPDIIAPPKYFRTNSSRRAPIQNVDTSNDSILVNGTGVTNDEIGDTCNNQFATADMNGVQCSVQSYWSKADNLCI